MVRAILNGGKTQTRRIIKAPTARGEYVTSFNNGVPELNFGPDDRKANGNLQWHRCPYGQVGDQLWVRETWGYFDPNGTGQNNESPQCADSSGYMMMPGNEELLTYWRRRITYRATWEEPKFGIGPEAPLKWHPSIHMPRWASRTQLEITNMRVERLLDISDADCLAEGINQEIIKSLVGDPPDSGYESALIINPILAYQHLWESINGEGSWDANPWVWVIEFKVIKP